MAEKEQDLRVQKTQRALAFAMLSMLETTPFSKITVRDLCTEAMISSSAFGAVVGVVHARAKTPPRRCGRYFLAAPSFAGPAPAGLAAGIIDYVAAQRVVAAPGA